MRLFILALSCLLLSNLVFSSVISISQNPRGGVSVITIKGDIALGDEKIFRNLALHADFANVILDSDGGKVYPAITIGEIIRIKGYSTTVKNANCSSACSLIWLAGKNRSIIENGHLGFHGGYRSLNDGIAVSDNVTNALIGDYLGKLGFSHLIIAFVTSAGPDEMKWLTKASAESIGLNVYFDFKKNESQAIASFQKGLKSFESANDFDYVFRMYSDSANAGFSGAQNNLGDLYEKGIGVNKNLISSIYWYTRSAERGEPTAYLSLASLLAKQTTDEETLVQALKFAILAAQNLKEGKNKNHAVTTIYLIKSQLNDSAKARAEELAKAWNPLAQEKNLLGDSK